MIIVVSTKSCMKQVLQRNLFGFALFLAGAAAFVLSDLGVEENTCRNTSTIYIL